MGFDPIGVGESEGKAKRRGDVLYADEGDPAYTPFTFDEGTTYEKNVDPGQLHIDNPKLGVYSVQGNDRRNYQYGRTATGAEDAVRDVNNIGAAGQQVGQFAINQGEGAAGVGSGLLNQRTGDAQYFDSRDTGKPWAQALAGLEATEGPSAAQAQLQAGTNQAAAQQLALARSGRSFGSGAAAMGQAQTNLAGINANQATSAAALRAQENAAWRGRQATNLNAATNNILASQAQNDAMVRDNLALGQDAYFRGQDQAQQGYNTALNGNAQALNAQQIRDQIRGRELTAGLQFEDNQLRAWAAQNGYDLAQQQRQDQQNAGYINMVATGVGSLLSGGGDDNKKSSDIRAKKNVHPDDDAGADFGRDLYFDGTLMRSKDDHPGGYDPSEQQGSQGASARPAYAAEGQAPEATPMQQQYFGAEDFARPDVRQPDTDALDAAAQDTVRNAPGSWYDYKDPSKPGANDRHNYGPMAQDLAKTPAGATAVVKQPDGSLGVDTGRLSLVNTSALSAQQKQLDDMSAQLDELNGRTKGKGFAPDFNTRYGVGAR